jgi:hypothetical protein
LTWRVRVANAGLKVDVFSASWRGFVRVAKKGLGERIGCRLESSKVEMLKGKGKELNADAPRAQKEEKTGESLRDWVDCDESMRQGSTVLALLSRTII